MRKRIVLHVPVLCVFSSGLCQAGGWECVFEIEVGCEVKPVNGKGLFVAGALFMGAAVVLAVNPPAPNTNGCEIGFGGVDCGVNENPLPLLFENGFALLAAVVGESTFGGPVLGKRLPALAERLDGACSGFEEEGLGALKPAKGFVMASTAC